MHNALARLVGDASRAHEGLSGFRLLEDALDALSVRASLADVARETLDIQYYIAHDGLTTRLLIQRVLEAADRGVRVRILLDDLTSHGQDARLAALAGHDNIQVRFFNAVPSGRHSALARAVFVLTNIHRMHRRMHNKLWLVDGAVGITGGRNLGDEYYGASEDMNFTDLDLLVAGPLVADMQRSFNDYWDSPFTVDGQAVSRLRPSVDEVKAWRLRLRDRLRLSIRERPRYVAQLRDRYDSRSVGDVAAGLCWARGEVLADSPERPPVEELMYGRLLEQIARVQHEFVLVSPYFVPGHEGIELLRSLTERGVKVRVLTNSLAATDLPLVHGGYTLYREALLDAGVELYEMRARHLVRSKVARLRAMSSLHTKALVFDQQSAFVGTFNMDPRSAFWNTEIGVLLHQEDLAGQLRSLALRGMDTEISYRVMRDEHGHVRWHYQGPRGDAVRKVEPGSLWRKFLSWGSRTFAPEELL
jgi:putative cardiolipin synthase